MSISFVRWQPWQEMETVRRQLDQLFEEMVPLTRDSLSTTVNRAVRVPAIELLATENTLILRAELPGFESQDLDIQVTREAVSLKGIKQSPFASVPDVTADAKPETIVTDNLETPVAPPHLYRSEFRYGAFHRVIELPVEVDPDQVVADFKQGILTLTLPKLEHDRRRAVKVALEG
jgi:HSP20 family protein